ncbi:HlyD family type I secretion periplasmic adaptor subunit [Bartonella sp. HY761]|uniref:HlyD family type I secretion periplasmic adaptor subunit n=1 Tax=Bartonella sp. HY761 TaxID=2979330 RepID=UPI0021FD3DE8|nr:HlyD family type I secretion periplasmic adaptor subunit [Bartonella sp. HY761]UXN06875.1 HlyD family type I secretion periplasmic adaptor subunit [Bartonella sp. HY761]
MNEWQELQRSLRRHLLIGCLAVVILLVGVIGWMLNTNIVGAVISQGSIVVESNLKKVQHPVGGVVKDLLVKEGDLITAGDVVMRLDATTTKANLAIISNSLDQFIVRRSRLESERDNLNYIKFHKDILARASDEDVAAMMKAEERLLSNRREVRISKKQQLQRRIAQFDDEIKGLMAQKQANEHSRELIKDELSRFLKLYELKLVEHSRLSTIQRQASNIDGEIGRLISAIAGVNEKIAETQLQIIQVDEQWGEEVGNDLREMANNIAEYSERKIAAEDQLRRIDIIAPQTGIVHQLTVHTKGGVISAGEPIMMIVPKVDKLVVEAKVAPQDIDQIYKGQAARLRFSAFNQKTTPEINGHIERVSADITTDQRTGQTYYIARLAIDEAEIMRLGDVELVAGMPVETFITTQERTIASYFIKPLMDQVNRAFRES